MTIWVSLGISPEGLGMRKGLLLLLRSNATGAASNINDEDRHRIPDGGCIVI